MTCPLCASDPHPPNSEPRKCAFEYEGVFRISNWSCLTMLRLRELCAIRHRDDLSAGSIGVIPIPDTCSESGYLVLTWYKDRGATPGAFVLHDDRDPKSLTLQLALEILWALKVTT